MTVFVLMDIKVTGTTVKLILPRSQQLETTPHLLSPQPPHHQQPPQRRPQLQRVVQLQPQPLHQQLHLPQRHHMTTTQLRQQQKLDQAQLQQHRLNRLQVRQQQPPPPQRLLQQRPQQLKQYCNVEISKMK